MKIINVNDIEELIVFKYESEKKSGKKTDLQKYLETYTNLSKIYVTQTDEKVPFDIFTINGEKVVFAIFEDDKIKNKFIDKMNSINYDMSSLKEYSIENIYTQHIQLNDIFYIDSKIYK